MIKTHCDVCEKILDNEDNAIQIRLYPNKDIKSIFFEDYEHMDLCNEHFNKFTELFIKFKENSK